MKPLLSNHMTKDLSIFPPINHENLPIPFPQPPPLRASHAPLNLDSDDHPSSTSSPPPKHNSKDCSQLIKLFDFALHFWNSKLLSFLTTFPHCGLFSSFRVVGLTASFLVFVWYWVRTRRRRKCLSFCGREESIEGLKEIIRAKDEKILQLLEQIAQMNKLLLARCKIPVSKAS